MVTCWTYAPHGLAELHDLLTNGVFVAWLAGIGIGAFLAGYRLLRPAGAVPRRAFGGAAVLGLILGVVITLATTRLASTRATCRDLGGPSSHVTRYGVPAYVLVVSVSPESTTARRLDRSSLLVNGLFWSGVACAVISWIGLIRPWSDHRERSEIHRA